MWNWLIKWCIEKIAFIIHILVLFKKYNLEVTPMKKNFRILITCIRNVNSLRSIWLLYIQLDRRVFLTTPYSQNGQQGQQQTKQRRSSSKKLFHQIVLIFRNKNSNLQCSSVICIAPCFAATFQCLSGSKR